MTDTRWDTLKAFLVQWHRPLQDGDGYSAEEVAAAEQDLGIRFPETLREWYLGAGRWYYGLQVQDYQLELDELDLDEGILVFQVENQEVCVWALHEDELAQPDPKVYDEQNEAVQAEHLSDFLLCSVIKETAWAKCEAVVMGQGKASVVEALDREFTLWFADGTFERYYSRPDALAVAGQDEDGSVWVMLSTKTESDLPRYQALLGPDVRWA